ncbi:flagellar protein FliT [Nitrosomonas aestuarii]|uniref:Flagellar protein FliT n=1 Tax=Nitrosomonas aestuarii TaxID=52441 RepID=A0A1I3ZJC8_9PROT|nr:flagellar protein FliT [Nitrosomonas aestuarii]PTN13133.1 flagellar protein FliT [Nitrosomonas aestuarii]SFK44040.1 flagellar protein FliT [Nitrosomonas aestuarii]
MNSAQLINTYEHILVITQKMLAAAQNSEWDKLIKLEQECKQLTNILIKDKTEPLLSHELQQRKLVIIHQVLDHDAQIRAITEPWMEKLQVLFNTSERRRNLQQAYEAGNAY